MMTSKIHVWHTGQVYIDQAMAFQEKTWHPRASYRITKPHHR
ncbi:hypothetical protein [Bacillus sp. 123MFChir2]|nr:hypothetical protein [Bacillus sp. 123MFChir2]